MDRDEVYAKLKTIAFFGAIAGVVVAIQALPYVGRAKVETGKTNVEVWGWNIAGEALGLVKPEFEQTHPETVIDLKVVGTAMQSRFLLSLSTGRGAPDIMQLQEREAAKYTNTGRLADLSSWAAKYENDFPPSFWQSSVGEDGKVYAIPWDIGPCAIFYKRWIFQKYGINPDKIETWDDFLAVGQELLKKSGGNTRLFPLAKNATRDTFIMLMQQNGGGFFNERGEIIVDSPQNLEALELIRKMLDSGTTAALSSDAETKMAYTDDSVATFHGAVWNIDFIKTAAASSAGQWGVFRLPAFRPGGLRTSNWGGSVLIVPASTDALERSGQFIEQSLCTVDGQLKQWSKGLYPAFLPATRDPRFDQPDAFFGGQHVAKLFAQDFEKVTPLIRTRDWNEAEQIMGVALQEWVQNKQDSKECLRQTAELMASRLQRKVAGN